MRENNKKLKKTERLRSHKYFESMSIDWLYSFFHSHDPNPFEDDGFDKYLYAPFSKLEKVLYITFLVISVFALVFGSASLLKIILGL